MTRPVATIDIHQGQELAGDRKIGSPVKAAQNGTLRANRIECGPSSNRMADGSGPRANEGRGATFHFTLPAAPVETNPATVVR
jgi:hypothetical protein